jgi:alkanesulfonate monooxygenase SsuD/methylene tetrahydromethanopterin reductase-like flavin-dependent oxidoreductase (luciferase family)
MTRAIEIGIGLPVRASGAESPVLLEWAARADAGPFSSIAVTDRVVYRAHEPLVALASAIGVTRRVRLATSILIAPTRETTLLARQAASIDALSGGRLTLGLGIGIREDDYGATGTAFTTRGRRLDEQLADLRTIWSEGAVGTSPARPDRPELLVGGYVDAVVRRIATWGDGFMAPGGGDPARMVDLWSRITAAWSAGGRSGRPRWVSASYFALGPGAADSARSHIESWYGFDPALAERRLRGIPTTEEAVRGTIQRQAEMGVDEFLLRPCSPDLEALDRLAELVDGLRATRRA